MRRVLMLIAIFVGACSYTFDSSAPLLPLVGKPPEMATLPRLNTAPVQSESFTIGADGHVWLVMQQSDKTWRAVQMVNQSPPEIITGDEVFVSWRVLYITKQVVLLDGMTHALELNVRAVGEHPGQTYLFSGSGGAVLFSGGNDQLFAYIGSDPLQSTYTIQRRDGYSRSIPFPKGIDPGNPFGKGQFFWDAGAGDTFYDRTGDGRIVGHSTTSLADVDLGIRPRSIQWYGQHTLLTCGSDGVRLVPDDGKTPETILDNDICDPTLMWQNNGYLYYDVGNTIRKAKLDGSEAPFTLYDFGTNRVTVIAPEDDTIIYSTDPATRYVHGAGDGWLKDWRFMERGTDVQLTSDRKKIYWLEHSAQGSGAGTLTSVTLPDTATPGGTPRPLALNVRDYTMLGDGRILCDANWAFTGTFNRLVVIDEKKGKVQWFADSANHWSSIPGHSDYLVDVVTGATAGHDVVRLPLPAPLP
jgi:hypothetical protein